MCYIPWMEWRFLSQRTQLFRSLVLSPQLFDPNFLAIPYLCLLAEISPGALWLMKMALLSLKIQG